MQHLLAVVLLFLTLSLASPIRNPRAASSKEFYLQTSVVNGTADTGSSKEGLYVYSYHTGAGLSDAELTPNKSIADRGFLNSTNQEFQYNLSDSLIWGLVLASDSTYASWQPVQIDADQGTPGFVEKAASGQLVGSEDYDFGGWLACDWWYGKPQLFYLVLSEKPYRDIPTSCSTVDLKIIAA